MSAISSPSKCFRNRIVLLTKALVILFGLNAIGVYSYAQLVGTRFSIDESGTVQLQYFGSDEAYYIVKRGDSLVGVFTIRDMVLGDAQVIDFDDGVSPFQQVYYQVDEVPLNRPLDSDKDGIDDAFELAHPNFLDPLNPLDAVVDSDSDGISNFEEYVRGTDIAAVSNIAPEISLLLPTSGAGFVSPASIEIEANASDQDGTISRVEFYQGNQKVGEAVSAPYSFSWTNVAEGDYVLTAVAYDDSGSSATTLGALVGVVDGASAPLTVINKTSPLIGSQGVAVTRETIITLSNPIEQGVVVDSSVIRMTEGDETLATRIDVSKDRRVIRVFYVDRLPSNSRVNGVFDGSLVTDLLGRQIDADGDGSAGGLYEFFFDTLNTVSLANTAVCGRVFASELAQGNDAGSVNIPLAGVRVSVDGQEDTLFTYTDEFGDFRLDNAPAGRFFVHIDGREVTRLADNIRYPDLAYYPNVGKAWVSIPNEEVNIGEIYLPLINEASLQEVSAFEPTVIGFPLDVIRNNPELKDVKIEVPANSLFRDDGTRGGMVGIAPVPPDRLPGELPEGLDFPVVFTVQTDGATNFDVPVPICVPNLDGLAPGAKSALVSFNHDTGRFEIVGPATVSEDGLTICTDPGVGITAPGWHGIRDIITVFLGRMFGFPPGTRPPPQGENQECAKNDCKCDGHCGSPGKNEVHLHSGEENYFQEDLSIPGRAGMDFVMRRTYRSQLTYDGPLGHGWNWDYNEGLWIQENGDVMRVNGRSHIATWSANGDGTFEAPEGYFGVMMQDSDGSYVLITPDGFERFYREDGRLFCHQDQYGNRMLFDYDHFGNLSKVIDVFGREIDFTFTLQSDGKRRLTKITDFIGREVIYEYDANGNLVSCRSPIVVGTSTGNDFPNGRTERYTYSSGFQDPALNHNLLSVIKPQEVADGGSEVLSWTYGTDPNDPLTFDKVLTETHGGTNASGVVAGGTMSFQYEGINQGEPEGQPNLPRGKAIITSRNGNVSEYFVNEKNLHIITREHTKGLRPDEPEFFESRTEYNDDGLAVRVIYPEGNEVRYVYDDNGPRRSQSNVLELREIAGPRGGGNDLVTTYTYEPLFNQPLTITEPRGNEPQFSPPIGAQNAERYTTRFFYDYQESDTPVRLAELFDLNLSSVPRGLGDLNEDGRTNQQFGNLIRTELAPVELLADSAEAARIGSVTQESANQIQWNDNGQVIAQIDAEGDVTEMNYFPANDPDGNGRLTSTRYVALGQEPIGYLKSIISDSRDSTNRTSLIDPVALKAEFQYDDVGNKIGVRDPRGVLTRTEYNQLDEPVAVTSGASIASALSSNQLLTETNPFAFRTEMIYDFNGRIIRSSVDNRDNAVPGVGDYLDTNFVYDILGNVVSESSEIDSTASTVMFFEYDENELLVKTIKPEGNTVVTEYDERDLAIRRIVAPESSSPSILQYDYDRNGNVAAVTDTEDTDGDGNPDVEVSEYDGFDRLIKSTDAMGNYTLNTYDPAMNLVQQQSFGHPPGNSNAEPVLHEDSRFMFDERNRMFEAGLKLFIADGFSPERTPELVDGDGDGIVRLRSEFDAKDRNTRVLDDSGEETIFEFDGLDRIVMTMDHVGNSMGYVYDANDNVVMGISTEKSERPGLDSQTFASYYAYDQLNRLVRVTDNLGQTRRYKYDRRNNIIQTTDAEGPLVADPLGLYPGLINDNGNVNRFVYDGLNRLTAQTTEMKVNGQGDGELDTNNLENPDGLTTVRMVYDLNSRLVSRIDDKLQESKIEYDEHDRAKRVLLADGSETLYEYDLDYNIVKQTDPNGTVVDTTFDALNRMRINSVAPAPGVLGTTLVEYEYDGLSRVTKKLDNGGPEGESQEVVLVYDSLSRIIEETQNGKSASAVLSGEGNLMKLTYPSGRQLEYDYDALDRTTGISEGNQVLMSTEYIGMNLREVERTYGNGTTLSYLDDDGTNLVGYDGVQRVERMRHENEDTIIVDREYDYNRMSFRTREKRGDDDSLVDAYEYDSLYRVSKSSYDTGGDNGAEVRDLKASSYSYDGVGNRVTITKEMVNSQSVDSYDTNEVNEYTDVNGQAISYDDNGNLLNDGVRRFSYDYKNRLVEVRDDATGNLISRYSYYSDNRRSQKELFTSSVPDQAESSTEYHYWGTSEIEIQDAGSDSTLASYVNNPMKFGEVFSIKREAIHEGGAGEFYLHSDVRLNVISVTDESGNEVGGYLYDDFGNFQSSDDITVPFNFQGFRYDEESGLYYARNRYYNPELGRFMQRDPVYDEVNTGNQYTFAGNSPITRGDPHGLSTMSMDKATAMKYFKLLKTLRSRYRDIKKARDILKMKEELAVASKWLEQGRRAQLSGTMTKSYQNIKQGSKFGAFGNSYMNKLSGEVAGMKDSLNKNQLKNLKGMNALSGVLNAVQEGSQSMNTNEEGAVVRVGAVAAADTALGITPHGAIASMGSGLVDDLVKLGETYELFDIGGPPKAQETFRNAGRSLGVLTDFGRDGVRSLFGYPRKDCRGRVLPNRGWQSARNLVKHMKTKQGSISRGLAGGGEWLGEKAADVYSWFTTPSAADEKANQERLRRKREAMNY